MGDEIALESRRGGIMGWGVFLIVLGALGAVGVMGLVGDWVGGMENGLVQPAVGRGVRVVHGHTPTGTDVVGVVAVMIVVAGMLWTGIGCCLGRRWVRPVVMVVSVYAMVIALYVFVPMTLAVPSVLDALETAKRTRRGAEGPTPFAAIALYGIRAGMVLGVGVVLPYLMWRFFANEKTRRFLEETGGGVTWLERVPVGVLGWSGFAMIAGLSALARVVVDPAVPAFVVILREGWGIVGLSVIAVLMCWGAWRCYKLERVGWIVTFVILALLRISVAVYLWTGGAVGDLLSDPTTAAAISRLQGIGVPPWWVEPMMASLDGVVVMGAGLWVARYFVGGYRGEMKSEEKAEVI